MPLVSSLELELVLVLAGAGWVVVDAVDEGAGCGAAPVCETLDEALAMLLGDAVCTVAAVGPIPLPRWPAGMAVVVEGVTGAGRNRRFRHIAPTPPMVRTNALTEAKKAMTTPLPLMVLPAFGGKALAGARLSCSGLSLTRMNLKSFAVPLALRQSR